MMNLTQEDIAGLYSQAHARGASPLGLVVALYDTILRDLRRASDAIARGDIEKRTFEMNHALRVIAELENVLDHERGGKVAARLQNFYSVTRGMILDASVRNSREAISQLVEIFGTVRQAWREAEMKMGGNALSFAVAPQALQTAANPPSQLPSVDTKGALRGSWRA